jgi:transcriptional adapter 2-alpha
VRYSSLNSCCVGSESEKRAGLRLSEARNLATIDVNKTRRIYDFLAREGFIHKKI